AGTGGGHRSPVVPSSHTQMLHGASASGWDERKNPSVVICSYRILKVTGQFFSLITGFTCDSMIRMIGEKSGKPLMRMFSTCKKISLVHRTEKRAFNQILMAVP